METARIIEALLFSSDAPLAAADIARVEDGLDEDRVVEVIDGLRAEYEAGARAFQIYEMGGGFQILTRPEFAPHLERFETVPQPSKLSVPALEVLAIVAYRQPIGRIEIEEIRGVGSSAVLRTLQDRGLIDVVARGEGLGRPLLYGTTRHFLEHFGFHTIEDLPRPDELPIVLRAQSAGGVEPAGEAAPGDDEEPAAARPPSAPDVEDANAGGAATESGAAAPAPSDAGD